MCYNRVQASHLIPTYLHLTSKPTRSETRPQFHRPGDRGSGGPSSENKLPERRGEMRSQVIITPKPMFFPLHTPRETPNTHDQGGWSPCYRGGVCTELFLPLLPKSSSPTAQTPGGRPKKDGLTQLTLAGWLAGWPHHTASMWSSWTPPWPPSHPTHPGHTPAPV